MNRFLLYNVINVNDCITNECFGCKQALFFCHSIPIIHTKKEQNIAHPLTVQEWHLYNHIKTKVIEKKTSVARQCTIEELRYYN